ncbi:MAG: PHP domain-containing protein [bacterium]
MKRALFLGLGFVFLLSVFIAGCVLPAMKDKPKPVSDLPSTPERTPRYEHDGRIIARASLHNHTTYSDGCRPADDLLDMAESQGMSILAYTDHREGKVCYGDHICADRGGVESTGYDEYYDHLGRLQDDALSRDMIVLKGVEVSPPYFRNHGKFPNLVFIVPYQ